jgi:hypothetical protein
MLAIITAAALATAAGLPCSGDEWRAPGDAACHALTTCTSTEFEASNPVAESWSYAVQLSGVCTKPISSLQQCQSAAHELKLADTTASNDGHTNGVYYDPTGCYFENAKLQFHKFSKNTGSCSKQDNCVCLAPHFGADRVCATHTVCQDDEWETKAPAMSYDLRTASRCAEPITSLAECTAAGAALGLGLTPAKLDQQSQPVPYDPVGCYREQGVLKFNGYGSDATPGANTGACTHSDTCVCRRHHTSDRTCAKHTQCTDTQFQTKAPTASSDRACATHRVCTDTQFETKASTASSDRACSTHTTCAPTQWETKAAGTHHDRVCAPHSAHCTVAQYELVAPGAFNDRECRPLTNCGANQWETQEPASYYGKEQAARRLTEQTTVAACQAALAAGTMSDAATCSGNGRVDCDGLGQLGAGPCACDEAYSGTDCSYRKYFDSDRQCSDHTVCSATQYETVVASASSDRQCADHSSCGDGQWETSAATTTSDRSCADHTACNDSQWEQTAAGASSDRSCKQHTACLASQFQTKSAGKYHDRECTDLTFCLQTEWEAVAPTATSNRACAICPVGFRCDGGQATYDCNVGVGGVRLFQDKRGQTSCNVCEPCAAGFVRRGCGNENAGRCEVCGAGYYKTCANSWVDPAAKDIITEIQAEDGLLFGGAKVERTHAGFTGEGFVDFVNKQGESATWTYVARSTGTVTLAFRYAMKTGAHTMHVAMDHKDADDQITINDAHNTDIKFTWGDDIEHEWSEWHERTISVSVHAGENYIKLTTKSESGPNLDLIRVTEKAAPRCVEFTCTECAPGRFELHHTTCQTCLAGRFAGPGATMCSSCAPGTFQAKPAESTCDSCDGFTHGAGPALIAHEGSAGHSSCSTHTACGAQQWITKSATATSDRICQDRTTCNFSTQWMVADATTTSDRVCVDLTNCDAGWRQDVAKTSTSDRVCAMCAQGQYKESAGNSPLCTPCETGEFQNWRGQSDCKTCNFFCAKGSQHKGCSGSEQGQCVKCTAGHFKSADGDAPCVKCLAGTAQSAPASTSCAVCVGQGHLAADATNFKFQDESGKTTCTDCDMHCPAGTFKTGCHAKSPGTCSSCPAGKFKSAAGTGGCTECPKGTSQAAKEQTSCPTCKVGEYSDALGAKRCSACDTCGAGFKRTGCGAHPFDNKGTCTACNAGKYKDSEYEWFTQCEACPPGRYGHHQFAKTSDKHCQACEAGQYSSGWGWTACTTCGTCDAGKFRSGCAGAAAGECEQCAHASFKEAGHEAKWDVTCTLCAAGRFGDKNIPRTTSTHCQACKKGTYSLSSGWGNCDTCTACEEGMFLKGCGGSGSGTCASCAQGSTKLISGAWDTQCKKCAEGKYGNNGFSRATADHCSDCEVGRFQEKRGQPSCDSCSVCAPGNERVGCYGWRPGQCPKCAAGKAKLEGSAANPGLWNSKCANCAKGTFALEGSATCTPCGAGRFQTGKGESACNACQPCGEARSRHTCALSSGGRCSNCPAGRFKGAVPNNWNTPCMHCAAGTFSTAKSTECATCPASKYQNAVEQASCKSCLMCSAGKFRTGCAGPSGGSCQKCPKGHFKATKGQWDHQCSVCAAGRHSPTEGGKVCPKCSKGRFQPTSGQATCATCGTCPSGKYRTGCSGTSGGSCASCAIGKYKTSAADGAWNHGCVKCKPGHYALATEQATCKACGPGRFQLSSGQAWCDDCQKCPAGRFRNKCGGTFEGDCVQCAPGQFKFDAGASWDATCSDCASGRFAASSGQSTCHDCQNGSYATKSGQRACNACERCSAGLFRDGCGGMSSGQCLFCAPGTFKEGGGEIWDELCQKCPLGKHASANRIFKPDGQSERKDKHYQPRMYAGAAKCNSCPKGTFADQLGLADCKGCQICAEGKFRQSCGGTSEGTCPQCAQGKFKTGGFEHDTKCSACEAGKYGSSTGAQTSAEHCQVCATGRFQQSIGATKCKACARCSAGKYRTGCTGASSGTCVSCAAGHFKVGKGSSWKASCKACATGQYQPREGATKCVACLTCGAGMLRTGCQGPSAGVCTMCQAGQFKQDSGATWNAPCSNCAAGKFNPVKGQSSCKDCSTGKYQVQVGQASCSACAVCGIGQLRKNCGWASTGTCADCTPGKFKATTGSWQSKCTQCMDGRYQDEAGQASCKQCTACGAGSSLASCGKSSRGKCTACRAGTFKSVTGSWNAPCEECQRGTVSAPGKSSCDACPTGEYQPLYGQAKCIGCSSCAGGTFRQHCGVASGGQCAACEDGAFKVGAQDWDTQCRVCATGRFGHVSYSKAGEQHCRDCPTGKFQLGPGQTSCAQCASCPAGFTRVGCGADSSGTCEKCAQGSFKDGHHLWNTGCSLCESGRYGSSAHSQTSVHHCINCPEGQHRKAVGHPDCVKCTAGDYQHVTGQNHCLTCPSGKFTPTAGFATCKACPIGRYQSSDGSHGCVACKAGMVADSQGTEICKACAVGRVSASDGASDCDACTVGSFQPKRGKTACKWCPTGKYQSAKTATKCDDCNAGKYAAGTGSHGCAACEAGRAQSKAGRKSCTDCSPGTYQDTTEQTSCKRCEAGRYLATPAGIACVKCTSGHFGLPSSSGESDASSCQACGHGRYQPLEGSTDCVNCLPGQHGNKDEHTATKSDHCTVCKAGYYESLPAQSECRKCTRIDGVRTWDSPEGATECTEVPVDCKPSSWGSWSTCTKSCKPIWRKADEHRGIDHFETGSHAVPSFEGRACKDFEFRHIFDVAPKIIVTPSHREADHVHDSVTAWTEFTTTTGFRACWRETNANDKHDNHMHLEYFAWVGDNIGEAVASTVVTTALSKGKNCMVHRFAAPFVTKPLVVGSVDHTGIGNNNANHDATVSWIEGITTSQFTFCVSETTLDGIGAHSAVNFHYLAFDANAQGSSLFSAGNSFGRSVQLSGGEKLVGKTCLWQTFGTAFQKPPMVIATLNHHKAGKSAHQSTTSWVETVSKSRFKFCTTENNEHDGIHTEATYFDWLAIGDDETGNAVPAGTQKRSRTPQVLLDASGHCGLADQAACSAGWGGGVECSTFAWSQTSECNTQLCPVDCQVGAWTSWSTCSKTCSGGASHRSRQVQISSANGGVDCPALAQTSDCNTDAPCSPWDLPQCQLDHVHCNVKHHAVNAERAWMSSIDEQGKRYYVNTVCLQQGGSDCKQHKRPDGFVECGALPEKRWKTSNVVDLAALWQTSKPDGLNPYDEWKYGTYEHRREGSFEPHVSKQCQNNQNCGLVDLGACHGCDTEQECADLGMSSTVFVTHHRKYMSQRSFNAVTGKHEQVQYHCRREGEAGCKCTCNAHPPCVAKKGRVLANSGLHANAYPHVPNKQDCCNMCTNHPSCGSWEFSSTKVCVLKSGSPQFVPVPASVTATVWSGCRAGEAC